MTYPHIIRLAVVTVSVAALAACTIGEARDSGTESAPTPAVTDHPRPLTTFTHPSTGAPAWVPLHVTEPCASEGSPGPCYWDAFVRGNGHGMSFWVDEDQTFRLALGCVLDGEVAAPDITNTWRRFPDMDPATYELCDEGL